MAAKLIILLGIFLWSTSFSHSYAQTPFSDNECLTLFVPHHFLDLDTKSKMTTSQEVFDLTYRLMDDLAFRSESQSQLNGLIRVSEDKRYQASFKQIEGKTAVKVRDLIHNQTYLFFPLEDAPQNLPRHHSLEVNLSHLDQAEGLRRFSKVIDEAGAENLTKLSAPVSRKDFQKITSSDSDEIMREVHLLNDLLTQEWKKKAQGASDEYVVNQLIKKGNLNVCHGLGCAEVNMIDDIPIVRVVLSRNEVSYVLVVEGTIDIDSPHMVQFLARQHIDSGTNRPDGEVGRNVVVILKKKFSFKDEESFFQGSSIKNLPRHALYTWKWWKDYWKATYKKPNKTQVGFGVACGVAQAGMAACVSLAKHALDPESALDFSPSALSFAYGTPIGAYISTYKNWTKRGTKFARTLKNSAAGFSFAYLVKGFINEEGFEGYTSFDYSGLMLHTSIIGNLVANNLAKTHWYDIALAREHVGLSTKPTVLKTPWHRYEFKELQQSAVEHQMAYLGPFTIRLLDLVDLAAFGLPLGKVTLWASIPLVEAFVLKNTVGMIHRHRANRYSLEGERIDLRKAIKMAKKQRSSWWRKRLLFLGKVRKQNGRLQGLGQAAKESQLYRSLLLKKLKLKWSGKYNEIPAVHQELVKNFPVLFDQEWARLADEKVERPSTLAKLIRDYRFFDMKFKGHQVMPKRLENYTRGTVAKAWETLTDHRLRKLSTSLIKNHVLGNHQKVFELENKIALHYPHLTYKPQGLSCQDLTSTFLKASLSFRP